MIESRIYNTRIAQKVGVIPSVLIEYIYKQLEHSAFNDVQKHDGMYWVNHSVRAFELFFVEFTANQIRAAIEKLLESGLLIKGNFNNTSYDRTAWYTINLDMYEEIIKYRTPITEKLN